MAIKYLNNIDLNKNELQNAVIQVLGAAPSNPQQGQIYFDSTDDKLYFYDGAAWIDASGDIKSVTSNNTNQLSVTNSNGPNPSINVITAAVTNSGTALATGDQIYDFVIAQNYLTGNESITLSGDITGSGTTSIEATIQSDAVEASMLNDNIISGQTELTSGIVSTDEIMISDAGVVKRADFSVLEAYMQAELSFPDVDVTVGNLTNRLPQITENVTIGDAADVIVTTSGDLIVSGDLTVQGDTTTLNTETLTVDDNIIVLNNNITGTPTENAGIEVERGTSDNVSIRWNETEDEWQLTNDGTNYLKIQTQSGTAPVQSVASVDGSITVTNVSGAVDLSAREASVTQKGIIEIATTAEALGGTDTSKAITAAGLAARSFTTSIGDGSATALNVAHNLNTRDVIVQIYDNSTYETVYADVVRTDADNCTITFATAPSSAAYKVLVTKID